MWNAQNIREAYGNIRRNLENAETNRRRYSAERSTWHLSAHPFHDFRTNCDLLRRLDQSVPEWMTARMAALDSKRARAELFGVAVNDAADIARALDSGDSYASAGHARDAAAAYRGAIKTFDTGNVARELAPRHPALVKLAEYASRVEAARAYIADLDAKLLAENAAKVDAWRAGEIGAQFPNAWQLPIALRVKGDTIETSRGAIVPATVAPILWRLVTAARAGHATQRQGMHVGPFQLDEVRADGSLVIGCHDISYAELERMAASLGYMECAA